MASRVDLVQGGASVFVLWFEDLTWVGILRDLCLQVAGVLRARPCQPTSGYG
jgi:hypothetical protein